MARRPGVTVPAIVGILLVLALCLTGCAEFMGALGYTCTADDSAIPPFQGIGLEHAAGVTGAIAGAFVLANNLYRNFTRARAMTKAAAANAGAIEATQHGASKQEVEAILSEGIPGKAKVEPEKVAEIVAKAKEPA